MPFSRADPYFDEKEDLSKERADVGV